jgi:hypothetical protein
MPVTYDPIATFTLSSATNLITFSSIPSTYTDLRVVFWSIAPAGNLTGNIQVRFNGDSGTSYSGTLMQGYLANVSSSRRVNDSVMWWGGFNSNTSTTIGTFFTADVMSYSGSTNKTVLNTWNGDTNGAGTNENWVWYWRNTSAINSITLTASGQHGIGTTATLYGIKKA